MRSWNFLANSATISITASLEARVAFLRWLQFGNAFQRFRRLTRNWLVGILLSHRLVVRKCNRTFWQSLSRFAD